MEINFSVLLSFSPLMIFTEIIRGKENAKKNLEFSDSEDGGKYATQAIENIRTVVCTASRSF